MISIPVGNRLRFLIQKRENKRTQIGQRRWRSRAILWSFAGTVTGGIEACGNSQWFIDLLQQLGHEVWIGDAAQIRASYVRKQKTDKRDAAHILKLLMESRFPRLWMPSAEQRDLRQLLIHRHKLVEIRTRVKNGLQHLMLNRGVQKKRKLWTEAGQKALRELPLEGWAGRRREDLLGLLRVWTTRSASWIRLPRRAAEEHRAGAVADDATGGGSDHRAGFCPDHRRCQRASQRGKQVASYLGLIPREHSSGGRQRLGAISKQGNRFVRMLLVEAAHSVSDWTKDFVSSTSIAAIAWTKAWPKWQRRVD